MSPAIIKKATQSENWNKHEGNKQINPYRFHFYSYKPKMSGIIGGIEK